MRTNTPTRRTRPKNRAVPRVALLFEATNAYARTQLLGIGEYILSAGPWSVTLADMGANDGPPRWLSRWRGDGVIVRGENRRLVNAVQRLGVPCVDLTPSRLFPSSPWVKSDDSLICELAANHFLERGFRNFAYCGDARFSWACVRGEGFSACLQRAGHACDILSPASSPADIDSLIDEIGAWLAALPKPVAVFTCYDNRGQQVLEACQRMRLGVPEEVAVLGVDNDEVLCSLSPPPLSSVILNPRRAGWEAAHLLDKLIRRAKLAPEERVRLIPPVGVATRQSTDILAVEDPRIASALRFIREHACDRITVGDILSHNPMSRRVLEMRFRKLIGRTPRQEVLRVQLGKVKELLVGTALPVWEIAARVGFDPNHLSVVFREETGIGPRAYRERYGNVPR